MRIALIKTSSMGDVVHTYPVVSDIVRAHPRAVIDWVVEEAFADLPPLHPSVRHTLPVALRRWRRTPWAHQTRVELRQARARIAQEPYDLVLDLQGLVKSAWLATWARGPRAGPSRRSAREPLASLSYGQRVDHDPASHAIERLRQMAAAACGYRLDGPPIFGLRIAGDRLADLPAGDFAVLLHATSRAEKQWPRDCWRELARRLTARSVSVVLPWGSPAECEEAMAIAEGIHEGIGQGGDDASAQGRAEGSAEAAIGASLGTGADVRVLPRLSLHQCALLLRDAALVVGVDTGLTHLATALERPTVALFAATPSWRFGPYWSPRCIPLGSDGQWPEVAEVLAAADRARAG